MTNVTNMTNMTKIANVIILLTLFANVACAEDAKSPVNAPQQGQVEGQSSGSAGDQDSTEEDHLELMALTYEGKDPFGADCFFHISGVEEEHEEEHGEEHEGEHGGEHHHDIVAKLGYSIHGEAPLDTIVDFQRYDLSTNTYYPLGSNEANTMPVMVSAVLEDENIIVDYNKLLEYEQNGVLVQSLRADLNDVDFVTFESALDEVLENNNSFEANQSSLNQLQRTVFKIFHSGHYDAAACSNFTLSGMNLVEFELGGKHGDHDDDHGDDDHGDDDHGDDDHGDDDHGDDDHGDDDHGDDDHGDEHNH